MLKIFYLRPQKKFYSTRRTRGRSKLAHQCASWQRHFVHREGEENRMSFGDCLWMEQHALWIDTRSTYYLDFVLHNELYKLMYAQVLAKPPPRPLIMRQYVDLFFSLMSCRRLPLLNTNTPLWGWITNPTSTSVKSKAISLAHVIGENVRIVIKQAAVKSQTQSDLRRLWSQATSAARHGVTHVWNVLALFLQESDNSSVLLGFR